LLRIEKRGDVLLAGRLSVANQRSLQKLLGLRVVFLVTQDNAKIVYTGQGGSAFQPQLGLSSREDFSEMLRRLVKIMLVPVDDS
jgi:hypothetical protein